MKVKVASNYFQPMDVFLNFCCVIIPVPLLIHTNICIKYLFTKTEKLGNKYI